jgi:predicted lipoprotein
LNNYADSFQVNTNSSNLLLLRSAFVTTYRTFQTVQYFNFAKAAELNFIDALNFYPEDTTVILNAIATNSYNIQTISNKAKGLQALDYLLYGVRDYSDVELLNWYMATPNATAYINAVCEELKRLTDIIQQDWSSSYLTTFKNNQGIDQSSSFFLLTNALVENLEKYGRTAKVGVPLGYNGIFEGTTPRLELIEARHSQISLSLLKSYIESYEEFLNGGNGLGYDDYLNTINASFNNVLLSTIINTQLSTIKTKINALEEPYANEIVGDRQKVVELFQAIQQLIITLKVDVASAMSIDMVYQDTDGD